MNKSEIEEIINQIKEKIKLLQEKYKVKPIENFYSDTGLSLVYLYKHLGKPIKIREIKKFVLEYHNTKSTGTTQLRHLRTDYGYFLLGSNSVYNGIKVARDEYMLVTLDEAFPDYKPKKREKKLSTKQFEKIKQQYNYCCATCGVKENTPLKDNKYCLAHLEQGHKDPNKELSMDNCIPQCQHCNGIIKNIFIFDNDGMARYINNVEDFIKLFKTNKDKLKAYMLLEEELKRKRIINDNFESI